MLNTKRIVIGLTGRARSGKDTVAEYLVADHGFKQVAFAGLLKEAAGLLFGLSYDQLHGGLKEVVDPYWGRSPREILQLMGTESFRCVFGDDFWVKALERRVGQAEKVVVSDVRFDNEAEWVRAQGGQVVRLVRDSAEAVRSHVSEAGVHESLVDWAVENNGSLLDLYQGVQSILMCCLGSVNAAPRRSPGLTSGPTFALATADIPLSIKAA